MEGIEQEGAGAAQAGWYPNPQGDGSRYWDGAKWTDEVRNEPAELTVGARSAAVRDDSIELNLAGVGLALVGAIAILIGAFLPQVESSTFVQIKDNSLIQSGDGWILVGCAIGIGLAVYAAWRRKRTTWAVVLLSVIAIGVAVYDGTGDRVKLTSAAPGARQAFGLSASEQGDPGAGIYVAGVGALLSGIGGLLLAGIGVGAARGIPDRRTKQCPDCAETVLADARVCKHCGYRFDQPTA